MKLFNWTTLALFCGAAAFAQTFEKAFEENFDGKAPGSAWPASISGSASATVQEGTAVSAPNALRIVDAADTKELWHPNVRFNFSGKPKRDLKVSLDLRFEGGAGENFILELSQAKGQERRLRLRFTEKEILAPVNGGEKGRALFTGSAVFSRGAWHRVEISAPAFGSEAKFATVTIDGKRNESCPFWENSKGETMDQLVMFADGTNANTNFVDNIRVEAAPDKGVSSPTGTGEAKPFLYENPIRPRDGVYTTVKNGHLFYGDERLRLWGVCFIDSVNLDTARRIRAMGYNAVRLWGPCFSYDDESAMNGKISEKPKANPSEGGFDRYDRFFAECKKLGMFIVVPGMHYYEGGVFQIANGLLADGSFVSGGSDWDEWKAAVGEKGVRSYYRFFRYFDERIRKINFSHAESYLNHLNPYTGKRYAEEEAIAEFENENENGFLAWSPEQGIDKWPAYFRNKLLSRWNAYLKNKYRDEASLEKVWGALDEGESLASGKILLKPLFGERNRYSEKRAEDLFRFLFGLVDDYNEAFRAHCRKQAPAGKGVAVVPFSFDTQYKNALPWLYANSKADVVNFGIYQWALTSSLTAPPSMYVVEGNTVENKPVIIYEINTSRPNPYRAEFPLRLAALASYQDWDGIFFHLWLDLDSKGDARRQSERKIKDEDFLNASLPVIDKNDSIGDQGFTHAKDPIMGASFALAGRIFLGHKLAPAKKPTRFHVGEDQYFGYGAFTGVKQTRHVFTTGSRLVFDGPGSKGIKIEGPELSEQVSDAVASGDEILWDWPNGRLIIDAPGAKAYVGPTELLPYRFKDGVVLNKASGVPFVSFGLVSADERPLVGTEPSKQAHVNAVFDARNTGFEYDFSDAPANGGFISPTAQGERTKNKGTAPIIQDKVGLEIAFPTRIDYAWEGYDFGLQKNFQKKEENAKVVATGEVAPYMGILNLGKRGEAQDTQIAPVKTAAQEKTGAQKNVKAFAASGIWQPIPIIDWNMEYSATHQTLRDSSYLISSVSRFDTTAKPDKTILLTEAQILFKAPANIEVSFEGGVMKKISLTFTQPPPLQALVAAFEKELGAPLEKKIVTEAYNTSRIVWQARGKKSGSVEVVVTETQGTMGIVCKRGE
ncbi:MAG: hypothetical protein JNM63_12120 [Spirochaetia bacterium]|nr:hypothetical protein [Spirochaetia bacterium]